MAKRPIIPVSPPAPSKTILHCFTHAGVGYEVRLENLDGACFAILYVAGTECRVALHPFPDEIPAGLSVNAVRTGYIAVAEWLVKNGRWPDADTIRQDANEVSILRAA